jgi:hypothetical protein
MGSRFDFVSLRDTKYAYCKMLIRVTGVKVCEARDGDSSNAADQIIICIKVELTLR